MITEAHADIGDLLPEDVPYLETLVRYILDHLYVIRAVNQKALDAEEACRKKATKPCGTSSGLVHIEDSEIMATGAQNRLSKERSSKIVC